MANEGEDYTLVVTTEDKLYVLIGKGGESKFRPVLNFKDKNIFCVKCQQRIKGGEMFNSPQKFFWAGVKNSLGMVGVLRVQCICDWPTFVLSADEDFEEVVKILKQRGALR